MAKNVQALSLYEGIFSGGARRLHTDLLLGLQDSGQEHGVLSIYDTVYREDTTQKMENDPCYQALAEAGIAITSLGRRFTGDMPDNRPFSPKELAIFQTKVAQTNLVISLKEQPLRLAYEAGVIGKPIIVCLHRSDPENQGSALGYLRSGLAHGSITACTISAYSAKDAYTAAGIPKGKIHVVPNGIDFARFKPSTEKRMEVRNALGIPVDASMVLYAARFDVMKDVPLFLRSAKIFLSREPDGRIIMCGAGMCADNKNLQRQISAAFWGKDHLLKRIQLLGIRQDMEALYAAADVVSSTSAYGETCPLVLIEGLACGAIPVATNVGDTPLMLDGCGIITTRQPEQIARSWRHACSNKYAFGLTHMELSRFGRGTMIAAYAKVFEPYIKA